jgi:hypothetical protein
MHSQGMLPARPTQRGNAIEETALANNPAWQALAACRPRQIEGATYSQLVADLAAGEVLVARVVVSIQRHFHPQDKAIACWINDGGAYNALLHGQEAGNREITGYYAVTTDRLLSLLFAPRV